MRDGRTSIALETAVKQKVDQLARSTGRTVSGQINTMLKDCMGYRGTYPCIVKSKEEFYWISPAGVYGKINRAMYRRFQGGGLPLTGKKWDDVFKDMEEACKHLGKEVCRQSSNGLVVTDIESFVKLHTAYK